ncbi:hypothetical protein CHLNCDRAFT_133825 [Chlorella variabilis]|uniref:DNA2/NAM7 helicase-like C-terminal domain-containing protein n=1 Tax=Chlorella variabilis TaxID=554065 RepID=E1ZFB5_CHLVA|nr:hypothetical protein CHLNCDRAFT_133825 [Chlorella variabilis]EFN55641.1 hypothetical protein CHLNCDRAFT_133825 [Chlorella variabilis]|eukprot:XP_005847743.1 hypothetical protein CHLNCDRAFT_133825 [Chlorella variabilis]
MPKTSKGASEGSLQAQQLPADPWAASAQGGSQQRQTPSPAAAPAAAAAQRARVGPPPPPAAARKQPKKQRAPDFSKMPHGMALHKKDLDRTTQQAVARLTHLFPKLPEELLGWLFHRLVASFAHDADADLLRHGGGSVLDPLEIPIANAVAVCNTITYAPPRQVVDAAAPLLADLCRRFLAGTDVLAPVERPLVAATDEKISKHIPLWTVAHGVAAVEAQALKLALEPGIAAPELPAAGGDGNGAALPPPPPPAVRGSVLDLPERLRPLFRGGASGGLLERLLRDALGSLPTATALAAPSARQGTAQLPLSVSPDIDFGTVCVSCLPAGALVEAAEAAASALPQAAGQAAKAAGAGAGSLLDLLHLSAPSAGRPASAGAGLARAGGAGGNGSSSSTAPVLHFRQLVVENTGSSEEVWLLGGIAAPSFPYTLAAIDDARLFWLDGHKAVRLDPQQQHTISVALSSADCAARRQEKGILQQLLLLVFATPLHSRTAQALACIPGAPVADVSAAEAGEHAAAGVAGETDHLKRLFDEPPGPHPPAFLGELPISARRMLACGRCDAPGRMPELVPAHSQKGRALVHACQLSEGRPLAAVPPLLQRCSRLLSVEEGCLEQDICRCDMWHVRLRLAVFSGSTNRYHMVSLAPTGASGAAVEPKPDQRRPSSLYRGPSLELLQPGGVRGAHSEYVLGVLDVPGLPEGRPSLHLNDTVYLRTAHYPQREIACLVAATEGSTCFLLLPAAFWALPDVAPLVPQLRTTVTFGLSGLFDGLVHVRLSFDRLSFRRMQRALCDVVERQHACWIPPGDAQPQPQAGAGASGREAARAAQEQQDRQDRLLLQPTADEVAATVAGLQECGGQALNAEQRQAIAAVLCGAGRAHPYSLFGPPGTGKTVTLVECTLQLLRAYPDARLLNYSADLLCSALAAAGLHQGDMLRVNDPRRPPFTVKEDVLAFCQYSEASRMFTVPYDALLPEALIPLSLLKPRTAGGEAGAGWGAVLCGDPRQLGPVVRSQMAAGAGLATSLLEICIGHHSAAAYDVMKLGRVPATSMLVRNYRSHRRLLDLPSKLFYAAQLQAAADPRSVLPPRWRELEPEEGAWRGSEAGSGGPAEGAEQQAGEQGQQAHEDEAAAAAGNTKASEDQAAQEEEEEEGTAAQYDEGQYQAAADKEEEEEEGEGPAEAAVASLLFYGVRGQQMREGDAPSYFNPLEASTVVQLVSGLLGSGAGVLPDHIGVMATYRKQLQVQKIRLLLRSHGLGAVRVGTVDDYQGQEERVVFISTVLSKPESLPPASGTTSAAPGAAAAAGGDVHLGFWRNPKRFNVAITRAKALLVVVGHPAVLLEDASWRELLRYCFSQGAYRGAGADSLRQRFRVDVGAAAGALPELPQGEEGEQGAPAEADDAELQRAIGQLAELALLGAGHADALFPASLDEMYAAAMDEAPFRVVL